MREPDRDPCGVREDRALGPLFALSVGFGPVFGPPSGALVIAPSAAKNDQSIPTVSSYSKSPWRRSRRTRRPPATPESADARSWSYRSPSRPTRSTASPCATPSDRVHHHPIGHPRTTTTKRVHRWRRDQRRQPQPQPVRDPPSVITTHQPGRASHFDLLGRFLLPHQGVRPRLHNSSY